MTITRRQALAMLAAAAGSATAPGLALADAAWDATIAAAKAEGSLNVYSANVGNTTHVAICKAFEKSYGISVKILEARASELRERIRTEVATGKPSCDVSHNGSTTTTLQIEDGAFQPHGAFPNLGRASATFAATDLRVPVFAHAYGILVNTKLVPAAEYPRGWQALTDPKWKGKILCDDVRALGGGSVFFFVTEEKFGRSYHDQLKLNAPVFSRDIRASERRCALGEFAIWLPQQLVNIPSLNGLPVELVIPDEGYTYISYELATVKNAAHPNAARLFMDFYLGDEAQLIHANAGNFPAVASAAGHAAPAIQKMLAGKLLGTTDAKRQDEMLSLAKSIYG